MYLHIGGGDVVDKKDIIGIFDMDTATISSETKKFLSSAEKKGDVTYTGFDLPKSFIVCEKKELVKQKRDKKQRVYLSRISVKTLEIRSESVFFATDEGLLDK